MGQAKLRGSYEQRKSQAIESKAFNEGEQKRLDSWLERKCPRIIYVRGVGSIPESRLSYEEVSSAIKRENKSRLVAAAFCGMGAMIKG